MNIAFESENILYVQLSEALLGDYLAMVNDIERVARFIGRRRTPYSKEEELAFIRGKLDERAPIFSMLEKKSGAFIGNIELMDIHDGTGELGIAITALMQDRGYGAEGIARIVEYGFNALGLSRVLLKVYPDNAKAIHVYEKCGFREFDRTAEDVFMDITR